MRLPPFSTARLWLALVGWLAMLPLAQAQNAPAAPSATAPVQRDATTPNRGDQKIEHIQVEDRGARVDELRYGGQTQSITVQPKANVPSYEVLPNDGGRARQGQAETATGGNGPRVWNVLKF